MKNGEFKCPIGTTNIYRTDYFIVFQRIQVLFDRDEIMVISRDTFYHRTKARDARFNRMAEEHKGSEGKRIPTIMYSRKYVK